ncbi:MAG TPA: transglycosylase SLT domain-containing protein [Propionibacteriaceae bacterium]
MRRLAQHAIVGVGFSAFVATAAVAGLSSPAEQTSAIAVPAPTVAISLPEVAPAPAADRLAADRAAGKDRASRETARIKLAAEKQAVKRARSLGKQTKAIAAQHARIKAELAAAAKKAAEEKAARARALANRGYEPGVTDPKEIARQILKNKFGYGSNQFDCFNNIITRESMWRVNATNPSSGAYGIPQALPGSKMASEGSDWRTNPATQIIWAVKYMEDRYGSPCSAWSFKSAHGWY